MSALFGKSPKSVQPTEPASLDGLPTSGRVCKFCGKDNLLWEEFNGKFALIDPKTYLVHHCKKKSPEDFLETKLF